MGGSRSKESGGEFGVVTHTMHMKGSRLYPPYLLLHPRLSSTLVVVVVLGMEKKIPNNCQNSFQRNEKFPSKVNVFSSWSCRKKTLYSWNKHSCSQRAPCPQWHSCSVAHTALQSSPDLYAHHFDLGREKKKEKPTCVFLLLVSGFLSSPCVSRAACILKAPHLMSPLTPDAARWASLLLFSAFFSFSKCHDSALSLPTLGRFLSSQENQPGVQQIEPPPTLLCSPLPTTPSTVTTPTHYMDRESSL